MSGSTGIPRGTGGGLQLASMVGTFVLLPLLILSSAHAGQSPPGKSAKLGAVKDATTKFAINLYEKVSSQEKGNIFISPLSLQIILALTYTGSKGETASEVSKLLSLPPKIEEVYHDYNTLLKAINSSELKLANRMFAEVKATLKKQFLENALKFLFAAGESVDFKKDTEKARNHINEWVEKNTNGKIKELLKPGTIDEATSLVLVNAIYFRGKWRYSFQERFTEKQPFRISPKENVTVEMMIQYGQFYYRYDKELQAQILALEYEGDQFRMLVILPDEIDGFPKIEDKLEKAILFEQLEETTVKVALPKFKIEKTLFFTETLQSLGVKTMFTPAANFSGLSDSPVHVSAVLQKSFVEVNENGTVAAAASAELILGSSAQDPSKKTPEFIADHPFIFVIATVENNVPIFIGRFTGPK